MPDPTLATVSASEIPALYGVSPYTTEWMLYQKFHAKLNIDPEESTRMKWGLRREPFVLEDVADRLRLEVARNTSYCRQRRGGALGCTKDAVITDPQRGPGAVEVKCVDWFRWVDGWTESTAPPHIELQLQAQLAVGNGQKAYEWGVIACQVGDDEVRLYMREAMPELHKDMEERAAKFLDSVASGDQPDVTGDVSEVPILAMLYPDINPEKIKVATGNDADELLAEFAWISGQKAFATKLYGQLRAKLLALAEDAGTLQTDTHTARIKRNTTETPAKTVEAKSVTRTTIKVVKEGPGAAAVEPVSPMQSG